MLTCGQNARRMGCDDANLAGSGCSECTASSDRMLTRRAFASLAGLAAGSVLLGFCRDALVRTRGRRPLLRMKAKA